MTSVEIPADVFTRLSVFDSPLKTTSQKVIKAYIFETLAALAYKKNKIDHHASGKKLSGLKYEIYDNKCVGSFPHFFN